MPNDFLAFMTGSRAGGRSLGELVAALPEVYQPLFGHPELTDRIRRPCDDRLSHVVGVCEVLEAALQRPLRVLDLGCAQGYFSLALAARGAIVEGIDFQAANIAVCQALAAEHPDFDVDFRTARMEDVLPRLRADRYDLVLGLSVFHHAVHLYGTAAVQQMLGVLAEAAGIGVFELARATEPLEWARSQPQDPRQLLENFAFVHEVAQIGTHLSSVTRPLFVASNHYWVLDGQMGRFDTWKSESHSLSQDASRGTRRYFFGEGRVVKHYRLDEDAHREGNIAEYVNEVAFLRAPPPGLQVPLLSNSNRDDHAAWLVREQLPGELLIDRMKAGKRYDAERILRDVLHQLVLLESANLYHNDVRTWNVLIGPDGCATLIDFGAISGDKNDCAWPRNLFLAFMIFTHEVLSGHVTPLDPLRPPAFNPDIHPEPYRSGFWDLLELPMSDWTFAFLQERVSPAPQRQRDERNTGLAGVIHVMEEAFKVYQETADRWRHLANLSISAIQQLNAPTAGFAATDTGSSR
ncbi:MAG: class I SAM-dependent methyltransferase [Rhodopila sp.]